MKRSFSYSFSCFFFAKITFKKSNIDGALNYHCKIYYKKSLLDDINVTFFSCNDLFKYLSINYYV